MMAKKIATLLTRRAVPVSKKVSRAVETAPSACTQLVEQSDALPQEAETTAPANIMATTEFVGDMTDYDRAIETDTPAKYNPIENRTVRTILFPSGRRFYAWVTVDEKGNRKVEVCQEYQDTTLSAKLTLLQEDIGMVVLAKLEKDPQLQKNANRFLMKTGKEYMGKCRKPHEAVRIGELIDALAWEIPAMPVYDDDMTGVRRAEFYKTLYDIIRSFPSMIMNEHQAYFPLTKEELLDIAQTIGLTKAKLLEKLKNFDLLYLTPSSNGLQTNVRINGTGADSYTAWRYCVLRNVELENNGDEYDGYDF